MSALGVKLRRDLRRQRGQFVAITVTVLLGVALFVASYDAYRGLEASYRQAYVDTRFANLTVTGGDVDRVAAAAEASPGVEAVQRRTQADLPVSVGGDKFEGRVVGLPAGGDPAVDRVEVTSGDPLKPSAPDAVLVEQHMADAFGLAPGDRLVLRGAGGPVPVRVAGVAASPEYFWPAPDRQRVLTAPKSFGVVFAPEPLARRLAGSRGPGQVAVYYAGGHPDAALSARLTRLAEASGGDALTRADQPSNSALQQDVQGFRTLAVLFPLLFLTAAGLAVAVLLRRAVTAQRPVIGMLRAFGYTRRRIVVHYLSFGVAAGVAGSALGAVVGVVLAGAITHAYVGELSIPVTVVEVSPLTLLLGAAFGVGATLLASALPAWTASRTPPAEAMRPAVPSGAGRRSLAERIVPPLRRLPARDVLILRSIERNRGRTLSTMLGVVLALCLILVSWGMVDTTKVLVDRQYNDVERQDAELVFSPRLTSAELRAVRAVDGVAAVEPGARLPATVRANGRAYRTEFDGFERSTTMHGFLAPGGGSVRLPARGVLAGEDLRSKLGVGTGDVVRVALPGGRAVDLRIAGFVDEPLGTYLYAPLESLPGAAREGNVALVRYRSGADRDTLRRSLNAVPGVVAFEDSRALFESVNNYLGLFYAFVGIMLVFGGAMAFALLFNAMTTSIAERVVELATLRAAGASHRTLARLITAENVLVVLLGIAPGLLAGYWLAALFMGQFSNDQFSFDLQMRTSTLVLSAVAIVVVALLSQLPGLRALRRLDVARVVRERAA